MSNNQHIQAQFPRKFGKYHLLAPLAQGGMGALYLAVKGDRGLERLLVIKTVLPHLADSEYLSRFRDEAKVVVKLSHGNLIPVFDAGQVGGELFLAMDFVEGRDLRAVWNRCAKKQVAFPIDVAVYIVKELCRGLAYAHTFRDLKLVHRDVSPPNILMSFSGEVKLTDFGLASSTLKLEKTAPGIIYGKVAYMSPEQARGEDLDGRSDIYAAAIVLWELLTGRQLFPPGKDQPQDLLKRARNPRVPSPSSRAPRVPTELDDICIKALAAKKEDRYATADEFREAVTAWLATEYPQTDASRIESFLHELFAEDIERERREREELLDKIRNRMQTMPPTDELRRALEQSGELGVARCAPLARERRSSRPGSRGRGAGSPPGVGSPPQRGQRAAAADPARPRPHARAQPGPAERRHGAGPQAARCQRGDRPGDRRPLSHREAHRRGRHGPGVSRRARRDRPARRPEDPAPGLQPHARPGRALPPRGARGLEHWPPAHRRRHRLGPTREGSVYFVMEYLDGVDLGTVIEREGAIEVRRSLNVTTQICRALAAAHNAGIIHRDLKPENIFLTMRDSTSDFVKVLDFGIAKSTDAERMREPSPHQPGHGHGHARVHGARAGRGQARGRALRRLRRRRDPLRECSRVCRPYEGDNFMEVLTKKAMGEPVPVQQLRPEVPDPVAELVVRAMARRPEDRPASMEVFEYEVTKCLSGRGEAVANILGMRTDHELVASLNPGLALPPAPSDVERRRGERASSAADAMLLDDGNTIADASLVDSSENDGFTTDAGQTTVLTPMRVRRLGLLGWMGGAAALLVAAGVILYVASGDSGTTTTPAVAGETERPGTDVADPGRDTRTAEVGAGITAAGNGGTEPATATDQGTGRTQPPGQQTGQNPGQVAGQNPGQTDPNPGQNPGQTQTEPGTERTPAAEPGMTKEEADKLLRQADAKRFSDPDGAIKLYQQVAKGGQSKRRAYLGMAEVAFNRKDWDGAISYARRAGGTQADRILGHSYLRKGDKAQARRYYQAVLEREPNDATIGKLLDSLK